MENDGEHYFYLSLIECVEKRRCLYDKRDTFYYNRNVKERAWKEVGEMCNKSGTDCKHRWKLLRERFCKELKRLEAPSGSGMTHLEEWAFIQPMMFLKDSLAPRRTRNNVEEEDTQSVSERSQFLEERLLYPETSATPPPPKKVKTNFDSLCKKFGEVVENLEKSLMCVPEQETADESFMKTMVLLMKDPTVAEKDKFQARMFQEVYRLRGNLNK